MASKYSVGINPTRGPDRMVEVLSRAILGGHKTWRVTDYPQDPTAASSNDYDLYDLDRETLAPLQSVWSSSGSYLEIAFDWTALDHKSGPERVPLSNRVEPEGPGGIAFVASLPLRPGFRTRYQIVDRWNGRGAGRLKRVTLCQRSLPGVHRSGTRRRLPRANHPGGWLVPDSGKMSSRPANIFPSRWNMFAGRCICSVN